MVELDIEKWGFYAGVSFLFFSFQLIRRHGRRSSSQKDDELWNRLKEQNRF
jgi:hypothetical protein